MKRMNAAGLWCASVLVAVLLLPLSSVQAHYVPVVAGVVQDWSVERSYILLDGVRYEVAADVQLSDETGQPVSSDKVVPGVFLRLQVENGIVIGIIFVAIENEQ